MYSVFETVEVANGQFSISMADCADPIVAAQQQAGRALYSGVTVTRGDETVSFPRRPIGAVPFAVSAAYAAKSEQFEAKKVSLPSASDPALQLDPGGDPALRVGSESAGKNAVVHGDLASDALRTGSLKVHNEYGNDLVRVNGWAKENETLVEVGNEGWGDRNLVVHGQTRMRSLVVHEKAQLPVYTKTCSKEKNCGCDEGDILLGGGAECYDNLPHTVLNRSLPWDSRRWHAKCGHPDGDTATEDFIAPRITRIVCLNVN